MNYSHVTNNIQTGSVSLNTHSSQGVSITPSSIQWNTDSNNSITIGQSTTGVTINSPSYNHNYRINSIEECKENEKYIKEKNFFTLNENNLYITKENIKVIVKKSDSGFKSADYFNVFKCDDSTSVLCEVNKLGYSLYNQYELILIRELPSIKQKVKLL